MKLNPIPETRTEVEEHVKVIGQLLDNPGWKLYQERLGMVIESEIRSCIENVNPHDAAKASGRVWALQRMLNWPVEHAKECKRQLEDPKREWPEEPDVDEID